MAEIIPAIMPKNYADLGAYAERVKNFVPLVQIDIMDGVFVRGKTWPYGTDQKTFELIRAQKEKLPFADVLEYEIDLMVFEPEHVIEDWMHAGARRIIVHFESTKNLKNIIRDVAAHVTRGEGSEFEVVSLGIAITTAMPVSVVDPYIDDIDFVQCMGIEHIGKQGESFDERVLEQLEELRREHPELILSVDGGVRLKNAKALVRAGANRLVSGSAIFDDGDTKEKIQQFYDILKSV